MINGGGLQFLESLLDVSHQGSGGKVNTVLSLLYLTGNLHGRNNLFNCLLIGIGVPSVTRGSLNSMEKYLIAQTPE